MDNWLPFTTKTSGYIKNTFNNTYNVAEGAIRSVKTIGNVISFAGNLERSPDYLHLASGYTAATAKINISESNGFGLERIFKDRHRLGKYKGIDCMYIQTKHGEKCVIFVGGGFSHSYKKILGFSIGTWIGTEINLHDKKFIQTALQRQAASQYRRVFWDLNPDNPKHFIYTEYIDVYNRNYKANQFNAGLNYQHFTIDNNTAISDEQKLEIIQEYDRDSVSFQRDIMGERYAQSGFIYKVKESNIVDDADIADMRLLDCVISFDIGETISSTAINAVGFYNSYNKCAILEEYRHRNNDVENINKRKTDEDYARDLVGFFKSFVAKYRTMPSVVYVDANKIQRKIIKRVFEENFLSSNLVKYVTQKHDHNYRIIDRISAGKFMLKNDILVFNKRCTETIEAFKTSVWCPEHAEKGIDFRLDDGSVNIDNIDCVEYAFLKHINKILQNKKGGAIIAKANSIN